MKKINFLLGILSVVAAGVFTSCSNDADELGNPVASITENNADAYSVKISANSEATFTLNGVSMTGAEVEFTNINKPGTYLLTVEAAGCQTQISTVTLGESKSVSLKVALVAVGNITVSQADAANGTVVENNNINEVATVLMDASGVSVVNGVEGNYSLVSYVPAATALGSIAKGNKVAVNILNVATYPAKAELSGNGAELSIKGLGNVQGYDFTLVNENGKTVKATTVDNVIKANIPCLGQWQLMLNATIENIESELVLLGTSNIAGTNYNGSYTAQAGATGSADYITAFLSNLVGQSTNYTRAFTVKLDQKGTAKVEIYQNVYNVTFNSNGNLLGAKINGGVKPTIVPSTVSQHSGGSAK